MERLIRKKSNLCFFFFHWVHQTSGNLCLCPQMPRVMDSNSQGIDLHFWGQALRGLSEKIQLVSRLKASPSSPLTPPPSRTPVFLVWQETCLFRCSLFKSRSHQEEAEWYLNNVGCACVCASEPPTQHLHNARCLCRSKILLHAFVRFVLFFCSGVFFYLIINGFSWTLR